MRDYTGLGALAWHRFSGEDGPWRDQAFFERIVRDNAGPALDVGCGTGRLLLPMLRAGLDVEGVEPSADMVAILRQRAERQSLAPVVHEQSMQALTLPRRYRTIIVPCGSFQLVIDRAASDETLRRFHGHLEPDGLLLLTIYNRWQELAHERPGEWVFRASEPLPDGTMLEKHARVERRRWLEQILEVTVRYRWVRDGETVEEQLVAAPERWYFRHELELMLERVGFRVARVTGNYTEEPARDEEDVLAFFAER